MAKSTSVRAERSRVRRIAGATVVAALAVGLHAPGAGAADDLLVIPVGSFIRGAEGDVVSIGSVAVPADLVGATCDVRGQTRNQISVHDGNDLLITTGGQTFEVPNFEDAGFITHEAGVTEALGSTIDLRVRLGPDGVSSGGFTVSIDCQPEPTPTVPIEVPTTEVPSTDVSSTTSPPVTESTTVSTAVESSEPPTTSTEPPLAPTVTEPSVTEPSVTDPPTTEVAATEAPTTAAPATTSPTSAPPPAGPSVESGGEGGLPATGSNTGLLLGLGAALIATGAATRRLSRAGAPSLPTED